MSVVIVDADVTSLPPTNNVHGFVTALAVAVAVAVTVAIIITIPPWQSGSIPPGTLPLPSGDHPPPRAIWGGVDPSNIEFLVSHDKLDSEDVWAVLKQHQFDLEFLVVLLPHERTSPWLQLAAFEHMIVYPEAALGCLSSTIFVSISTANPIPICAMPQLPVSIFPPFH